MATFADLKRFLELDGWQQVENRARGRSRAGDHWRYEKPQSSGRPLRTKVSMHPNEEIGPDLFRRILKDQLHVDEATFREVLRGGRRPSAAKDEAPTTPGKPGWLVALLIPKVGLSEADIEALTTEEALRAWEDFQVRPT